MSQNNTPTIAGDHPSQNTNVHIRLYGPPAAPNTPSLSGYCQKLEAFFRLVSFKDYTLVPITSFRSSPTGKVPYITIHTNPNSPPEILADSHFIIRNLIKRGIVPDPDASLTEAQKADSRSLCVWVEQHIYLAVVHQRWSREHNVANIIASLPAPGFLRPLIGWYLRRNIVSSLWTAGVGRYSDEEIDELVKEWLDALEVKLVDGREWLMGVGMGPSLVDVTVWGFLINFMGVADGNIEVVAWIRQRKFVCEYVRRGATSWFPEYDVDKLMGTGDVDARTY